jgi:hypothetical protein
MVRPQVADGGKAVGNSQQGVVLQIGGWVWGEQLLTIKYTLVTKFHKGPWSWMLFLDKRSEPRKMDMRSGVWNVRSLYRASSFIIVAKEHSKYFKLNLVRAQEVSWDGWH